LQTARFLKSQNPNSTITLKDLQTGEETVVFSCFNQDQSLDKVDWANLRTRLQQNGVQEKLTKQWIDRCLHQIGVRGEAVTQ